EAELDQIDFIDSCTGEEEEEDGRSRGREPVSLSSQFMAYMEKRIIREGSPVKAGSPRDARNDDSRRYGSLHNRVSDTVGTLSSPSHSQRPGSGGGVERMRREAQLAAQRYEEERQRVRGVQREPVRSYAKQKSAQSPPKVSPTDSESLYPSRRSTHTDDSALLVQGEDRASLSSNALAVPTSSRGATSRPESFLYRLSQREEKKRGESRAGRSEQDDVTPTPSPAPALTGVEAELVEQLRKNIESRLKVSLPNDLGAALTDGVVLCHLANHVRPRSVPSIHVPSPAVPKLTMAKCRRNVENFLEACRKIGVPQAPKKKQNAKQTSAKGKSKTEDPAPPKDETWRAELEGQIAQLQNELERECKERNYFQVLRDKSYTFWEISKKQLEEKEADLRNRDKEMEEAAERRHAEIKMYDQKVKNLLYEQQIIINEIKTEGMEATKLQVEEHAEVEKTLENDELTLKADGKEQELSYEKLIKDLRLNQEKELTKLRNKLEAKVRELEATYEKKLQEHQEAEDLRRETEIHEIKQRKNLHIDTLMRNHEKAFNDLKNYNTDIARTNHKEIDFLKEQMAEMKENTERLEKETATVLQQNEHLMESLQKPMQDLSELQKQLTNYNKIKASLVRTNAYLKVREKDLEQKILENEMLEESFSK
ncbi:leucine-rich repeat and calponin homology domain-containing protein 3 isoform X5, partial [Clarias magur]